MDELGTVGLPQLERRPERWTLGIRTTTPFRGMFGVRDALLRELSGWLETRGLADAGPLLLRYHTIDMAGAMDVEVACVVPAQTDGDDRVVAGRLPAGTYAHLEYVRYAMRANKALVGWARDEGVVWDRWDSAAGDAFRCRYEAYWTDPRVEPRRSVWRVELAIKVVDEP
jgi:hypothetical protein